MVDDEREHKPAVSVVVVICNMPQVAPRTLHSLSAAYQRHIGPGDYEVIVVDSGSDPPLDPLIIENLGCNFRLIRIDSCSPAHAVNRGLAEARGDVIGVMIDGARMVTPGLLHFARHGARLYDKAVVATLGWYLGYDFHEWSIRSGYDAAREEALLNSVCWPNDGYRLFEIGTMEESSLDGWFQPISESNALFLRRELWESIGGVDERFDSLGINLDTFHRVLEEPGAELVILLGEATFRQLHGGTSAHVTPDHRPESSAEWSSQYEAIRGRPYDRLRLKHPPTYIGTLPRPALARVLWAATHPTLRHFEQPLGDDFDKDLWTPALPPPCADEITGKLIGLAENEFRQGHFEASCTVARLIRQHSPDEPRSQQMLSLGAGCLPAEGPLPPQRLEYHLALAEAHEILGEKDAAASNYRAALTFNGDLPQAHNGLARLRMPGDDYLKWLERLYRWLKPETAIEIGVFEGASLALFRPPTVAIGIDPSPSVIFPLKTETHIFAETSDEFFAKRRHWRLLGDRPLPLAFIDGLHLYEQVLRDFISLEACCGPRSVILIHDAVPLDERTQSRTHETTFYTGDVWKAVLCLKLYRPDLDIFTIATPPAGLTVVTGLDPASVVLKDNYKEGVARFRDTSFSAIESTMETALNIVPNDWRIVRSRLKSCQHG